MAGKSGQGHFSRSEYARLAYLVKRKKASWLMPLYSLEGAIKKAGLP